MRPPLPAGCLLAAACLCATAGENSGDGNSTLRVIRADLPLFVEEEGELQAADSISVGVQTRGTITFLAPEGSEVEKGDVLIELDATDMEERISRRESDLETAQKRLKELHEKLEAEKASLDLEIEKRKTTLEVARVRLDLLRKQPLYEDLQLARKNLESTQVTVQEAQRQYELCKSLCEKQYATKADLENRRLELEAAQISLKKQQMLFERVEKGPDPFDLQQAQLNLRQAELQLQRALLSRDAAIPALEQSIAWEEAGLASTRNRLRRDREELDRHKVRAPADGTVVHHTFYQTHEKFQVGNRIWPGIAVLELPDTDRMKIRSKVPESAIQYVSLSDEVTVGVATIPGETFPAKINWIDHWARDRNADLSESDQKREGLAGAKVFDVEAELTVKDERLKMGLKATLKVKLQTLKDVVCLDRRAVRSGPSGPFVIVADGLRHEQRSVSLGPANDDFVQILSGLEPGETVLLP